MKNDIMTIQSQRRLAEGTYEMILQLPHSEAQDTRQRQPILPGQFLNIRLEGFYLRRPISICDWTEDTLTIIYKTVGRGTTKMSRMQTGEKLDVLWPLGNGYDLSSFGEAGSGSQSAACPLLIACGPEAMLRAVDEKAPAEVPGQMSFERRMGCGFGACMGCSCRTKYGSKRICMEGPILERSEIVW